jgi:hypothetical protein
MAGDIAVKIMESCLFLRIVTRPFRLSPFYEAYSLRSYMLLPPATQAIEEPPLYIEQSRNASGKYAQNLKQPSKQKKEAERASVEWLRDAQGKLRRAEARADALRSRSEAKPVAAR